jgi:hypothetical protein
MQEKAPKCSLTTHRHKICSECVAVWITDQRIGVLTSNPPRSRWVGIFNVWTSLLTFSLLGHNVRFHCLVSMFEVHRWISQLNFTFCIQFFQFDCGILTLISFGYLGQNWICECFWNPMQGKAPTYLFTATPIKFAGLYCNLLTNCSDKKVSGTLQLNTHFRPWKFAFSPIFSSSFPHLFHSFRRENPLFLFHSVSLYESECVSV